jgi:hypothetical protein
MASVDVAFLYPVSDLVNLPEAVGDMIGMFEQIVKPILTLFWRTLTDIGESNTDL